MKKRKGFLKKILGTFAALAMTVGVVSGSAVSVKADGEESPSTSVTLTIHAAPSDEGGQNAGRPAGATGYPTYNYYVMMWANVDTTNQDRVSYYVDKEALASALNVLTVGSKDLFTVEKATSGNYWNVTLNKKDTNTDFTGDEVASALNEMTNKENLAEQQGSVSITDTTNGTATFTINKNGYVLVTSSLGTKLVADTYGNKEIYEKNIYPTSTKKQSTSADGNYSNEALSREVGQDVYYHIEITIPSNANKQITVTDTCNFRLNGAKVSPGSVQ